MKYLDAIFEDKNIHNLIDSKEELINLSTDILINYNINLEMYVNQNLDTFISENELAETYANIRNFILESNLQYFEEILDILNSSLTESEKRRILNNYLTEANISAMPAAALMKRLSTISGTGVASTARKASRAVARAVPAVVPTMGSGFRQIGSGLSTMAHSRFGKAAVAGLGTAGLVGAGTLLAGGTVAAAPVAGAVPAAATAGGALGAAAPAVATKALGTAAPAVATKALGTAPTVTTSPVTSLVSKYRASSPIRHATKAIVPQSNPYLDDLRASAQRMKDATGNMVNKTGGLVNTLQKAKPAGVAFPTGSAQRSLSSLGGNRFTELQNIRGSY